MSQKTKQATTTTEGSLEVQTIEIGVNNGSEEVRTLTIQAATRIPADQTSDQIHRCTSVPRTLRNIDLSAYFPTAAVAFLSLLADRDHATTARKPFEDLFGLPAVT